MTTERRGTWKLWTMLKELNRAFQENMEAHDRAIEALRQTKLIAVKSPSASVESLDDRRQRLRSSPNH